MIQRPGLPFELSSQIRLTARRGGEAAEWNGRGRGEGIALQRGDTKEESSGGWKRALKVPTAIIPRRYLRSLSVSSRIARG